MKQINNTIRIEDYTEQNVYDSFNSFIFSKDTKVLAKLLWRTKFLLDTKDVPGDIVECGVFKGSGLLSYLKIKSVFFPNAFKKVIGFDFFNTDSLIQSLTDHDKETMNKMFVDRNTNINEQYIDYLYNMAERCGFDKTDLELIKGDVSITSAEYLKNRPGAKISLLYVDVDLEKPTYDLLTNFWPLISKGGIIVLDDYGYHQWTEAKGADKFADDHNLIIYPIDASTPTAYIIK